MFEEAAKSKVEEIVLGSNDDDPAFKEMNKIKDMDMKAEPKEVTEYYDKMHDKYMD